MTKYFTPIIILIFLTFFSIAQEDQAKKSNKKFNLFSNSDSTEIPKNLYLWGKVLENDLPLAGAQVLVYRDGIKRDVYKTDSQGFFDVYLDYGFIYSLEFGKPGYVTKKLMVEADNIPMADREYGYETGDFKVEIFREVKGVDFSIYDKPIGKIFYSVNSQQFVYDRRYIAKMKKETEPLELEIAEKLSELESDQAFLKDKFDVYIRDGKIEFEAEDYDLAKTYFKEALNLFPNEEYPINMVAKIDSIQNNFAESEALKLQRYIAKADSSFDKNEYENATLGYQTVLGVDPTNDYAKKRLLESKDLLAAQLKKIEDDNAPKPQKIDISNIEINTHYIEKSREIAKKYPQGVSKEEYKQGNKIVYLIYVVEGSKGVEYKKVKHDWGGEYYFRNEESIPKFQYNKETLSNN
jgi:tetratricopeptide (TPR) repeat protein